MSAAQRRLWFLDQVDAGLAYTMPILFRWRGPVDAAALRAALADVAARHESLRTRYVAVDGEPRAHLLPAVRPVLDEVVGEQAILAAARHRFDLAAEPPIRATLGTDPADPDAHALLLVLHHVAVDGWSLPPLVRDLSAAYRDRLAGREPDRTPVPAPAPADGTAGLGYWRERLRGLPDGMVLPRRPDRPAAPGPDADTVVRRLPAGCHAELTGLGRRYGATLFMVLHTGLAAVLSAAGAGDDIVLGAPVAGRDGPAAADAVGFFVNLLVLRTELADAPTVADLLTRVREADLAAFTHQDVGFDAVVAELNPPRRPGHHPLVDVVLALQNNDRAVLALPDATAPMEVVRTGAARFGLLVDVTDEYGPGGAPAGIAITVEYRRDEYDAAFAMWLADALTATLAALPADPTARIAALVPDPAGLPPAVPPLPAVRPEAGEASALSSGGPEGRAAPPSTGDTGSAPAMPVAEPHSTELAGRLAAIWADVLGLDAVGPDDDFFALGGNSLRAVRVAARIATAERLPATAQHLFTAPTVTRLARLLVTLPAEPEAPIPRRPRVPRPAARARE
jgi:hypothetical protein